MILPIFLKNNHIIKNNLCNFKMLQHSVQNVAPETVENFKNYETVEENRFFSSCKKKIAYISLL